jgi:DedD protein
MKPDTPESDIQQDLKKSARRRLMGAALFVIVVATGLPLVMDATPPPTLNDFRIVTEDEKRAAAAPVSPPVESLPRVTDGPAPVPVSSASVETKSVDASPLGGVTPPVVVAASTPVAVPSVPAVVESKPTTEKPVDEVKPADKKLADRPADKPAEKAAEKVVDKKPADTKKESKDPVTPGQFYIQVGVFADADNVKQVRAKLKSQGIASWTEEATGNLAGKTRVKAGPFASRDAADKALAKITKAGLSGLVVKK